MFLTKYKGSRPSHVVSNYKHDIVHQKLSRYNCLILVIPSCVRGPYFPSILPHGLILKCSNQFKASFQNLIDVNFSNPQPHPMPMSNLVYITLPRTRSRPLSLHRRMQRHAAQFPPCSSTSDPPPAFDCR